MICYDKLWEMLIDKRMSKTELKNRIGVSNVTFAKFGKNIPVNLKYIDRVCKKLDCKIEDVVEIILTEKEHKKNKRGNKRIKID